MLSIIASRPWGISIVEVKITSVRKDISWDDKMKDRWRVCEVDVWKMKDEQQREQIIYII